MDAIRLLETDHQKVSELFEEYEAHARGSSQHAIELRARLVGEITRELSVHAAVEEQLLYPAVRESIPDGDSIADEGLEEHQEVKELLAELEDLEPSSAEYDARMPQLMGDVRHHVHEEETEMFPKLRAHMAPDRLEELGRSIESRKAMAPTRPHPHAPNQPPANTIVDAAAAVADKARDALSGQAPAKRPRKSSARR